MLKRCLLPVFLLGICYTVVWSTPLKMTFKAKPDVVILPIKIHGNLPLVEAKVNGRTGQFIFDTGASRMVLNERHFTGYYPAEHLAITSTNGDTKRLRVTRIREFELHGLRAPQMEVPILDLNHIEQRKGVEILGLLGRDVFWNYELVIDLPNQVITLYRLGKKGRRKTDLVQDMDADCYVKTKACAHLPCLRVDIGKESLEFGIDTGAETNFLRKDFAKKIPNLLSPGKAAYARGVSNHRIKIQGGMIQQMKLGDLQIENVAVMLSKRQHLRRMFNTPLDGILGVAFLQKIKVSINFRKRQIGLWLPAQTEWTVDESLNIIEADKVAEQPREKE